MGTNGSSGSIFPRFCPHISSPFPPILSSHDICLLLLPGKETRKLYLYHTTSEGDLVDSKKKEKGKKKGNTIKCVDEAYYVCQPVACGAGDGSMGCVVQ